MSMSTNIALALGIVVFGLWLSLLVTRRGFGRHWREPPLLPLADLPMVVAVLPAPGRAGMRDIQAAARSLLAQDYPGLLKLLIVAEPGDGGAAPTLDPALALADDAERASLLPVAPRPEGWSAEAWALRRGLASLARLAPEARYILFAAPDIIHESDAIARLVARAEVERLDLISLKVRRRRHSAAERALVPALLFFFRLRYPFAQVNDPASPVAAAGESLLVRLSSLRRIGGLAALGRDPIDPCAFARALKLHGPIRLDMAQTSTSLAGRAGFGDFWREISHTAYAELGRSPRRLVTEVAGMSLAFLLPPALTLFAAGPAAMLGLAGWVALAVAFLPTLRYYRASALWAPLLPAMAAFYLGAMIGSACRHDRNRGHTRDGSGRDTSHPGEDGAGGAVRHGRP